MAASQLSYLSFPSQAAAAAAIDQINRNIGYPLQGTNAATGKPAPNVFTTSWAIPQQTLQNQWILLMPEATKLLNSVSGYTTTVFSTTWFADPLKTNPVNPVNPVLT